MTTQTIESVREEQDKIVKEAMKQLDYIGVERQRMEDLLYSISKQSVELAQKDKFKVAKAQYKLGKKDAHKEFLDREIKMECLICGKSLHYAIMNREIRIHLCTKCRKDYLEESLSEDVK